MALEIYGGKLTGFSGSFTDDGFHAGMPLDPCPFCGQIDEGGALELRNTHTPCYSVHCDGCATEGPQAFEMPPARSRQTQKGMKQLHLRMMAKAVQLWNERNQ